MAEQRWPAQPRHATDWDAEITEVIPFNEFGALAELMFREHCAFDKDFQVIHARELGDDLDLDADQAPLRLLGPVLGTPPECATDRYRLWGTPAVRCDHRGEGATATSSRARSAAVF